MMLMNLLIAENAQQTAHLGYSPYPIRAILELSYVRYRTTRHRPLPCADVGPFTEHSRFAQEGQVLVYAVALPRPVRFGCSSHASIYPMETFSYLTRRVFRALSLSKRRTSRGRIKIRTLPTQRESGRKSRCPTTAGALLHRLLRNDGEMGTHSAGPYGSRACAALHAGTTASPAAFRRTCCVASSQFRHRFRLTQSRGVSDSVKQLGLWGERINPFVRRLHAK